MQFRSAHKDPVGMETSRLIPRTNSILFGFLLFCIMATHSTGFFVFLTQNPHNSLSLCAATIFLCLIISQTTSSTRLSISA